MGERKRLAVKNSCPYYEFIWLHEMEYQTMLDQQTVLAFPYMIRSPEVGVRECLINFMCQPHLYFYLSASLILACDIYSHVFFFKCSLSHCKNMVAQYSRHHVSIICNKNGSVQEKGGKTFF